MIKKVFSITLILVVVCTVFLVFSIFGKSEDAQQYTRIILKVAGDNNFPPYEYVDENGSYTGFNVDILRAIALQTGIEIQFHPMTWKDACEKLKLGEVDMIEGMKFTKERSQYYDFSEEYLENSQSIFVKGDNGDIDNFQSLSGKKVGVQRGDMVVSNLQQLQGVNIIYAKDQQHAMQRLLNGEVDAYIGNTLAGVFLMNREGTREKIKIVGETLNPAKYAVAVKKGDDEILEIINRGLKEIKKNGTYDKIYRKWFGQSIQLPSWYVRRVLLGIVVVLCIFMIGMFIFYRWNHLLKKEVKKQTHALNAANENLIKKNVQIKQERDFREQILNQIFSGIVTVNREGIITFANRVAHQILSMEDVDLIGKHYQDTLVQHIFYKNDLMGKNHEKELIINNQNRIIHYKVNLLNSVDEEMDEIIIIFRDVTEERWMQENIKTKDKLQSLGNLIAGIAHEIRNPLTSIKTYAELIPKKFDNSNFRKMVSQDIPLEIDRLNSLIRDLLEYSRPRKPFKERIDLLDAIHSALKLLKNKIKKDNIDIEMDISKDACIYMDKNHLRQILLNIFLNAVESMDKGEKKIRIAVKELEHKVLLQISDNGSGMDKDSLGKVYNPFYTTKPNGTGLGLFVCYQLLTENKAKIKFQSVKGEGTTCTIQFYQSEEDVCGKAIDC